MNCFLFRHNWGRLLFIYTAICVILLISGVSPTRGSAITVSSYTSGGSNLVNGALPIQGWANAVGLGANLDSHIAHKGDALNEGNDDDMEGPSIHTGMASASLPPSKDHHAGAVPNDESRNMGLLANIPRSGVNSDLAFWGNLAIAGNYDGFRVIDITNPQQPRTLSTVACRGPQNDVSVWNNLVFLSIDRPQTLPACSQDAPNPNDPSTFEGIRIFNISDPANPQFVTAVPTDCGSHTHTLIPDLAHNRLLLYVSSYFVTNGPHCGPGREADGRHKKISIVSVPLDAPEQAAVIATPEVDADPFFLGSGPTIGCHDITVFLDLHIAAAACMSEGQLWDITDPANPQTLNQITRIRNNAFSFWHSSTFSWDGRDVIFSDETFSNGCASPSDADGRIWIYSNSAPYQLLSSFVQPRPPSGSEYCSAHLFNAMPAIDGANLFASSWYEGAVDIVNFDNPSAPQEEGFYHARQPVAADTWSAYWYNNYIYAGDIARGFDVFSYTTTLPHQYLQLAYLNPQTQERLLTPPSQTVTTTPVATGTPNPTSTIIPPPATATATATAAAATATATVAPCTTIPFTDVSASDYFYAAVRYLYCHGVVSGYSDNTFRPYNNTPRGQLSKIVVLAKGWPIDTTGGPHFTDVPESNSFYGFIETAYNHNIISGYADNTFRPGNNITRAQLSKVIVLAMAWTIDTTGGPHFTDVPESNSFYGFIETAYNRNIISGYADNTFRPGNDATRGQICKIIYTAITAP